jgi:secondary thiamine-phosphate synthase enzyme
MMARIASVTLADLPYGDAHLKSLLIHHQVIIPVTAGKMDLGPWQQVFYAEFDGQRRKRVIIKVMGE